MRQAEGTAILSYFIFLRLARLPVWYLGASQGDQIFSIGFGSGDPTSAQCQYQPFPAAPAVGRHRGSPGVLGGGVPDPQVVSVGQPDGSTVGWRLGRLSGCFHHELGKYEAVPHSPSTCFMAKLSKASWAPQGSLPPCWCRKHSWTRACKGWGCPAPVRPPDFIWEPYAKLGA